MSPGKPGVEVNSTRKSYCLPSSIVSSALTWCGGASNRRDPSSIPAGYASHTGYQYDSISRVAGQRELAPPSNLSKEGGCRKSVFKGIRTILTEGQAIPERENPLNHCDAKGGTAVLGCAEWMSRWH